MLPSENLAGQLTALPDRRSYLEVTGQALMNLIPCDLVGWNALDVARGQAEVASFPSEVLDHDAGPEVLAVATDHPMVVSYAAEPAKSTLPLPRRMSDLVTQLELHRTAAYNLLLRPLGAERQLAVTTVKAGTFGQRGWALNRDGSDFSDDEVELLRHLQPLLQLLDVAYSRPKDRSMVMVAEQYGLTPRELQILEHCRSGLTNAAVGQLLAIRPATVAKHLQNAYTKLGVYNRISALAVLDAGVLQDQDDQDPSA